MTTAAAMEGSDDALAEVANAGGVVGSRRADALAEMASQMASMREELAALRAVRQTREAARPKAPPKAHPRRHPEGTPEPHESQPFAPCVASDKENSQPSRGSLDAEALARGDDASDAARPRQLHDRRPARDARSGHALAHAVREARL